MSDDTTQGSAEAREPRPSTERLARAIGARLGARLPDERCDVLAAQLAAAAEDGHASAAPTRWRRTVLRRPAALVGALSAFAVLVAGVGIVTRTSDDLPVLVLATGASGAQGASMAMDAGVAPEAARTSPMIEPGIALWQPTRYTFALADGVTIDVDRSAAWRFVAPDDVAADAARLASAFGLPAPAPSEGDPSSWTSQAEDGANLWVASSGDWFYGGPHDLWSVWDCPVIEPRTYDGEGATDDGAIDERIDCIEPEPPVGVPSAARARELALALLETVGLSDVRISDVYADEWSAWVTVERELPDGSGLSGLAYGVGFVGEERVASASGTLARLERIGDYPLVGVPYALVRLEGELNAWLDGDAGDPMQPMPLPALPDDVAPGDGAVSILPLPEEGAEGGEPLPTEPDPLLPVEEVEEVEPVDRTVVVVEAQLVTSMAWTPEGTLLLVPHYRLVDADGGWWFVVAVEDGYFTR